MIKYIHREVEIYFCNLKKNAKMAVHIIPTLWVEIEYGFYEIYEIYL